MSTTTEAILADLADKVAQLTNKLAENTAASVELDITTRTEMKHVREDIGELRTQIKEVSSTLADHSHRLTVNETRVYDLQDVRNDIARVDARISVAESQITNITPQRTPWTAIVSAMVALGALAWTLFGQ